MQRAFGPSVPAHTASTVVVDIKQSQWRAHALPPVLAARLQRTIDASLCRRPLRHIHTHIALLDRARNSACACINLV
jgi:hypothetical protein